MAKYVFTNFLNKSKKKSLEQFTRFVVPDALNPYQKKDQSHRHRFPKLEWTS